MANESNFSVPQAIPAGYLTIKAAARLWTARALELFPYPRRFTAQRIRKLVTGESYGPDHKYANRLRKKPKFVEGVDYIKVPLNGGGDERESHLYFFDPRAIEKLALNTKPSGGWTRESKGLREQTERAIEKGINDPGQEQEGVEIDALLEKGTPVERIMPEAPTIDLTDDNTYSPVILGEVGVVLFKKGRPQFFHPETFAVLERPKNAAAIIEQAENLLGIAEARRRAAVIKEMEAELKKRPKTNAEKVVEVVDAMHIAKQTTPAKKKAPKPVIEEVEEDEDDGEGAEASAAIIVLRKGSKKVKALVRVDLSVLGWEDSIGISHYSSGVTEFVDGDGKALEVENAAEVLAAARKIPGLIMKLNEEAPKTKIQKSDDTVPTTDIVKKARAAKPDATSRRLEGSLDLDSYINAEWESWALNQMRLRKELGGKFTTMQMFAIEKWHKEWQAQALIRKTAIRDSLASGWVAPEVPGDLAALVDELKANLPTGLQPLAVFKVRRLAALAPAEAYISGSKDSGAPAVNAGGSFAGLE